MKTMRDRNLVRVVMSLAWMWCSVSHAQEADCMKALIQDTRNVALDSASSYALIDLLNSTSLSDRVDNTDLSATIKGVPVSLRSDRARRRAETFFRQTQVKWDQRTKVSMVSQTLSEKSVDAYRACVDGQLKSGPRVLAFNATPETVQVKITWIAPVGAPTEAQATYEITGAEQRDFPRTWKTGSDQSFVLTRKKGQSISLVVNIGGQSDRTYIPYVPRVKETVTEATRRIPGSESIVLSNDGTGHTQFTKECVYAAGGEEFDPQRIDIAIEKRTGAFSSKGTFAKVTSQSEDKACFEAQLSPLSKGNAAILKFYMKYQVVTYSYEVYD
jgi:hypothetical protein